MPKAKPPAAPARSEMQLTVEVGDVKLTAADMKGIRNRITKAILGSVRETAAAQAAGKKKEPYVKILHVKSIPKPPVKQ